MADNGYNSGFPLLISNWIELVTDLIFWFVVVNIFSNILNKYEKSKKIFLILFFIVVLTVGECLAINFLYPKSYIESHSYSTMPFN